MRATRYKMDVLIRYENPDDGDTSEKIYKHNVTATSELVARRKALEVAWSQGMIVSGFMSIQTQV